MTEVKNPDYDGGKSATKAATDTAASVGVVLATAISVVLVNPELMKIVMDAAAVYPKTAVFATTFFAAARFGFAFWRDYQKHGKLYLQD